MRVLITGGTGLIGSYLSPHFLQKGHDVTILSRSNQALGVKHQNYVKWDGKKIPEMADAFDVIINLAGAGVIDHKWTSDYKKQILDSRVNAARACVEFIQKAEHKPHTFISASAVGYYGTKTAKLLDEKAPPGTDFLSKTCLECEKNALGAGIRTVILRLGLVLASKGGAFPRLLTPFKYYAGSYLGDGNQPFPWIHIYDVIACIDFLIENPQIQGAVNAVAPNQLTNKGFAKVISKLMRKPSGLAIPALAVKLMLGESAYLLLEGQNVNPKVLLDNNYSFIFSDPEKAIAELLTHVAN